MKATGAPDYSVAYNRDVTTGAMEIISVHTTQVLSRFIRTGSEKGQFFVADYK